ncbi:MAG: tRNA 4-thiouridine(8) synthase ThiI [Deltaproteobacteria bacterium]|nr:tRNA 4-thiouridine(8) synthase ThiI [Deltaproteobacteria bacterium]
MRALCVFSGGLDSILAAELIRAQGIYVLGIFFETPFFSSMRAVKSAESMSLPLKVVDISRGHLEVIKNPRYGYGKNMNPCIDCHAYMFRIAGEMLEKEKADFVITGEVLGQRPMSQTRKSLLIIDRESGLDGLLLRPLSAKCLTETIPQEKKWINIDLLMDIKGRSRKPQMGLARKMGITEYPAPGGGCLLTETVFSRRLKDLLYSNPDPELREIELLKIGRHFRISPETKIVVGRDEKENDAITGLSGKKDTLLSTPSIPGPAVLISGSISRRALDMAASIAVSYSDLKTGGETKVCVSSESGSRTVYAEGREKEVFKCYMI